MNLLKKKSHPALPANLSAGQKAIVLVANGFGLGQSPVASGTVGALLGIPLAIALSALHGHTWPQVAIAAALTYLCVPLCDAAEKIYGTKDDGRIVADEYLLFPICIVAQRPLWNMFCTGEWFHAVLFLGMAFVISRVSDIIKAYPARQLQDMHGGLGIVLDDFFADVYAWVVIWFADAWLLTPHVQPFLDRLVFGS